MNSGHQHPLPEGGTEAPDLLKSWRSSSRVRARIGALVGTVVALIIVTIFNRIVDSPSDASRSAGLFEANALSFGQSAEADRQKLKEVADDQKDATVALANAMEEGKPRDQVQRLMDGDGNANGFGKRFDSYQGVIDDIDLLVKDGATKFQHSEMQAFDGYKKSLLQVVTHDVNCLSRLKDEYKPTESQTFKDVRCMIDAKTFYLLHDQLTRIDDCEAGINHYLHDTSQRLLKEAQDRKEQTESATVFSRIGNFWNNLWGRTPTVTPADPYWNQANANLDATCTKDLVPPSYVLSKSQDDGFYPPPIPTPAADVDQPNSARSTATTIPTDANSPAPSTPKHDFFWRLFHGGSHRPSDSNHKSTAPPANPDQ